MSLARELDQQQFGNGYELVDGVAMHAENGDRFQIPHRVLKDHFQAGFFVELRIDSPRFSAHPDAPMNCTCPHCDEEATKPILTHEQPASLFPLPPQDVPSRGWGEDFWVQINQCEDGYFSGTIDNPLCEQRLHQLSLGERIVFHEDHVLAIHPIHPEEIVGNMSEDEILQLVEWLQRGA